MKKNRLGRLLPVLLLLLFAQGLIGCSDGTAGQEQEISDRYEYAGELKGNLAHGYGTLHEDGVLFYEGEFKDGIIHGQGKLYENNILKYEGEFQDANIMGAGILYSKSGGKLFEGTITENDGETYKGIGILFNEDEEPAYEGEITVIGDKVHYADSGKLLYPSGAVFYEGELDDGVPTGQGTYYDPDGGAML